MPGTIEVDLVATEIIDAYPARLHGAACALLEVGTDHRAQRKPFSVWPVADAEAHVRWRIGWLDDTAARPAVDAVRFGETQCPVLDWRAHRVSFAELARSASAGSAQFQILSPLYFSRNGRDHPLPDPVLMVRSTLERWNAHAPADLLVPDDCARALVGNVYLDAMEGETRRAAVSRSMNQTGFVGDVRLRLLRRADHTSRVAFAALMRFAEIAGFGAQTTHGFGAARLDNLE